MDEEDKKFFEINRGLSGKIKGGTLEDWSLQGEVDVEPGAVMWGNIYGDNRWIGGERIHTSKIIKLDREQGFVETKNTFYLLGKEYIAPELTEEEQAEEQRKHDEAVKLLLNFI